tara:strand:+ start:438 stop:2285 length:1848 start_codon:yes stop_codon:yes gene_type:complete
MAETRTINVDIKSNADATAKDFEKVADSVGDVDSQIQGLNKGAEGGVKGFKKMSTAAKGLGTALKAAGIGLVIAAFAKFTEVLNENQKVADFFSTTFEALSLAFNDFFNFIFDNVGGVVDSFKAIFEDPIQSIKNFGQAIVDNIVERFNSAIESIGFLGDAIVKVFKGDFAGAAESAKNAGKELIDVVTGVDNTFDKTVETVNNVIEATTNYVSETVKAAKATVDLNKQAEIAAVRQQGIVEQFDRQAEKLRQVRDEERNTIEERIEANNKLKETLDEQEEAALKLVDLQIAAAAAQFKKNQNQENEIALIEAQQERLAVLAQVEGFRSEQLANDLALDREKIELTNTKLESEATLSIERKRLNASKIEDDLARLEREKEIDAEEEILQTERLQRVIDEAKEGTQAKVDAQIALDEFEVEIAQKKLERDKEISDKEIENAQTVADAKKAIQDSQLANAEAAIGLLKNLAGENNKLQALAIAAENAVGIAKIVISTQAANAAAKLKYAAIPGGLALAAAEITANKISAGIGIAASVAAAAKGIASLKASAPLDTGGDLGGGGAGSEPQAPNFNVVGDSGVNQLATLQQQPTQAFVVSGEVTTAQALDRNRVQNATL